MGGPGGATALGQIWCIFEGYGAGKPLMLLVRTYLALAEGARPDGLPSPDDLPWRLMGRGDWRVVPAFHLCDTAYVFEALGVSWGLGGEGGRWDADEREEDPCAEFVFWLEKEAYAELL
jgi:hypothetical protein